MEDLVIGLVYLHQEYKGIFITNYPDPHYVPVLYCSVKVAPLRVPLRFLEGFL